MYLKYLRGGGRRSFVLRNHHVCSREFAARKSVREISGAMFTSPANATKSIEKDRTG